MDPRWNYCILPTRYDIAQNRSPFFLCVLRGHPFAVKAAFNISDGKWYRKRVGKEFVDEVNVLAWMPVPIFNYDTIVENTLIA